MDGVQQFDDMYQPPAGMKLRYAVFRSAAERSAEQWVRSTYWVCRKERALLLVAASKTIQSPTMTMGTLPQCPNSCAPVDEQNASF